jgi:RNA polymerase sigma-70 factor (ECF subfamily)
MTTRSAAKLAPPPESAEPGQALESQKKRRNQELLETLERDPETGARLLVRTFSKDVNRLVWRLLGADPEHSDIVQQVFFKVLSRSHALRDPEKLGAWIQSITVNTIYQELRGRELQRWLKLSWRPPRVHGDLVQEMEARDFLLAALGIVNRLPAKERIVFCLRFVEDKTVTEIAELCGFSEGTAKRRLRAAHARFQRFVAQHPDLERWFQLVQEQRGGGL